MARLTPTRRATCANDDTHTGGLACLSQGETLKSSGAPERSRTGKLFCENAIETGLCMGGLCVIEYATYRATSDNDTFTTTWMSSLASMEVKKTAGWKGRQLP